MRKYRYTIGKLAAGASGTWDAPEPGLVDQFKQQFADAVAKLDDAVLLIPQRQQDLLDVQAQAADDPDDATQWQTEWDKLESMEATVNTARAAVEQVNSWWNSAKATFGLSGSRLGVLQFAIPWGAIGVITAAGAAIAAVLVSTGNFVDALRLKSYQDAVNKAVANGEPVPPNVEPVKQPSLITSAITGVADTAKIAVLIVGALFVFKLLRK